MKVKTLIELLQKHSQEVEVFTEGCDCIGTIEDVITCEQFYSKGRYALAEKGNMDLMITRTDE